MSNIENNPTQTSRRRLIPVSKWNDHHVWPPIGGLRYLIFHKEKNGFSDCLRKVGKKLLIDESRFFEWVDKLSEDKNTTISKQA